MDLLHFRLEIAESLCSTVKQNDLQSDDSDVESKPNSRNCSPIPGGSKRYDGFNHWPVVDSLSTARMCRLKECGSRTRTRCEKCNVYLCLTKDQNCFKKFHCQ